MTTSAIATDLVPETTTNTTTSIATTDFNWDTIADNPFNIGAHPPSMAVEEWWVLSGMHVRLPANMAERPDNENKKKPTKLLVVANTISGPGGRGEIYLDDMTDVVLIGYNIQLTSKAAYRSMPAGHESFRMAVVGHAFPTGTDFHLTVRGGTREGRSLASQGFRWGRHRAEPDMIEFYFSGPLESAPNFERYAERRLPLPTSGAAFDFAARTFLSRLLLTAHSLFDANRSDDAYRVLERLEAILDLHPNHPSWQQVAAQCLCTREMFAPQLSGSDLVPALTPSVYRNVVGSYKEALQEFAKSFGKFVNRSQTVQARQETATNMLGQQDDALKFQALVTSQLEQNLNAATRNLEAAQASIETQSQRVEEAQQEFDAALETWRRQRERAANMAIASAVFTGVVALGKLFAGKPTNVAEAAEEMTRAAQQAAKLAATLAKLAKIIKAVTAMVKMIRAILPAMNRARSAAALAASMAEVRREAMESDLQGAPSESAYWDQFWEESEAALKPALDANIPKAPEYLLQLRIFIIYGRALTAAQAAIPPIAQELAQSNLLTKLAEEQRSSIHLQIQNLKDEAPPALAATLWLRHRSVRRAMYAALQDYHAARRYWALSTTDTPPSPNHSIASMANELAALADMDAAVARALKSFNPAPQEFLDYTYEVPPSAVEDFLREGHFSVRLTPEFSPMAHRGKVGRVRVNEVAVWVIWNDDAQRPATMEFTVRTDGDYYDQRLLEDRKIREFRFIGPRVNQAFEYDTATHAIKVPARVARNFAQHFSEPTMFTGWNISLPRTDGVVPREDIEALAGKVKGITLAFWGEFIKDEARF